MDNKRFPDLNVMHMSMIKFLQNKTAKCSSPIREGALSAKLLPNLISRYFLELSTFLMIGMQHFYPTQNGNPYIFFPVLNASSHLFPTVYSTNKQLKTFFGLGRLLLLRITRD